MAADAVLIPIQCEYLALEGLSQLLDTVRLVQERLNPHLRIGGMAMTMFDSRTHLALQVIEEVAKHFPDLIFHTVIPRSVRIAEAPSFGEPLVSFDPKSRGAQAYAALTDELLAREAARQPAPRPASGAPPSGPPAVDPPEPNTDPVDVAAAGRFDRDELICQSRFRTRRPRLSDRDRKGHHLGESGFFSGS